YYRDVDISKNTELVYAEINNILTPLTNSPKLKELYCRDLVSSDISSIANLSSLEILHFSGSKSLHVSNNETLRKLKVFETYLLNVNQNREINIEN
ncbi:MAG: hypothetical protein LBN74_10975, partial [Prevotella sp.]|nr:hypothetical protein [Prevotella sp.]